MDQNMIELTEELEQSIKEYIIAIKLGQYSNLIKLSSRICHKLVELIDYELDEIKITETGDSINSSQSELIKSVEVICAELRKQSHLAGAYKDIVDFVSNNDLICLSRLVGTTEDDEKQEGIDDVTLDNLCSLLKKAVLLLKNFNDNFASELILPGIWIDRERIERIESIRFPIYRIKLSTTGIEEDEPIAISTLTERMKSSTVTHQVDTGTPSKLKDVLMSEWFQDFLENTLCKMFPMNRFTILVSIWIISEQCKHVTCQQLISELVDQIYHEEVNTNNKEELMRLTQVGSFWLSYHKRYKTTFNKQQQEPLIEQSFDDDYDDRSDELNNTLDRNHADLVEEQLDNEVLLVKNNFESNRIKLRKTIDQWLLYGNECFICGHNPSASSSTILQPLSSEFCSNCKENLKWQHLLSSQMFNKLNIVNLVSFEKRLQQLDTIFLLSPNEWARWMLNSKSLFRGERQMNSPTSSTEMNESVDKSDNFDRFRVRRPPTESRTSNSDGDNDDDDIESDSSASNDLDHRDSYKTLVEAFMRWRDEPRNRGFGYNSEHDLSISESLSMMRYLLSNSRQVTNVIPLCISDILILEDSNNVGNSRSHMKVCLLAEADWLRYGTLWICNARSAVSGLIYGCKRLFTSVELSRHADSLMSDHHKIGEAFLCLHCGLSVMKFSTLFERLRDS